MAKPAKIKDVSLTYDAKSKSWTLSGADGGKVSPKDFAPIKVDYGYEGKITFTIKDSPRDVTFAGKDPMLAAPVTDPPSKPTKLDPQFTILPSSTPTKLVVRDLNGVPGQNHQGYSGGDYNYVLNFNNASPIDPIISNSGCCQPAGGNSNFYFALGGVALLALLVLVLRPILAKRRTPRSRMK